MHVIVGGSRVGWCVHMHACDMHMALYSSLAENCRCQESLIAKKQIKQHQQRCESSQVCKKRSYDAALILINAILPSSVFCSANLIKRRVRELKGMKISMPVMVGCRNFSSNTTSLYIGEQWYVRGFPGSHHKGGGLHHVNKKVTSF